MPTSVHKLFLLTPRLWRENNFYWFRLQVGWKTSRDCAQGLGVFATGPLLGRGKEDSGKERFRRPPFLPPNTLSTPPPRQLPFLHTHTYTGTHTDTRAHIPNFRPGKTRPCPTPPQRTRGLGRGGLQSLDDPQAPSAAARWGHVTPRRRQLKHRRNAGTPRPPPDTTRGPRPASCVPRARGREQN